MAVAGAVVVAMAAVAVEIAAETVVATAATASRAGKNKSTEDRPPETVLGGQLSAVFGRFYLLSAGVSLSFNRSLPRISSTSYSWPAFISPSADV